MVTRLLETPGSVRNLQNLQRGEADLGFAQADLAYMGYNGQLPGAPERLSNIRGIAVMGIFSVNVVGMAMIESAYFYPPDYGFHSLGDRIMWAANFLIVDGKFRALFSILFGASMVLVIERSIAAGKAGWKVHYARMAVLLLFGLAHFYLLWWGDILANYALVGMIAFVFWRQERSFAQRAEAIGGRYKSLPRIEGFNLGTGRAVSIGVYQSLEAPSQ